jgi:FAD:protein FMN transferase
MSPDLAGAGSFELAESVVPGALRRSEFGAMGTSVCVLTDAAGQGAAAGQVERLFARWEERLSRFRPDSELSRLNARSGRPVVASDLLLEVVSAALRAARATSGLYDPTLLRAIEQLGYDRSFERIGQTTPPLAGPIAPGGGWRRVRVDHGARTITLPAGVGIDLGGIAKGMAVDAAIERLRALGVGSAMVSAGGDLRVLGTPPGELAWRIELPGPAGPVTVPLTHGSVATSGIGRRRWRQGRIERHHLLDPRSARPARTGLWSVTVAAATCAQAEVAAKTAFILGVGPGAEFLAGKRLAGLFTTPAGERCPAGSWPTASLEDRSALVEEARWSQASP